VGYVIKLPGGYALPEAIPTLRLSKKASALAGSSCTGTSMAGLQGARVSEESN